MQDVSQKNRNAMFYIAIVIGLLMIGVVPFLVQTSLERVLSKLLVVSAEKPAFKSGLTLFDTFYPIWRAVIFVGGITLIVTSGQLKKGKDWVYPLDMFIFALPSIGGMFMFLPYVSFVDGFPVPMVISWFGLAGFWSFIFLYKGSKAERWARFAALTFMGMLATHSFTLGIGSRRQMWTRPTYPLYPDFKWWLFNWLGEVNWIGFAILLAAIPLVAVGKKKGWWMTIIATFSILAIDAPTQFIRTSTLDYLYGSLLAIGTLIFTMVPYFKEKIITEDTENYVTE